MNFYSDWTAQQAEDKKRLEREQKEAERLHQLKAIELDQRATELAEAEEMTRKTLNEAMRDYNLALVGHCCRNIKCCMKIVLSSLIGE